jgi:hypothetical protein
LLVAKRRQPNCKNSQLRPKMTKGQMVARREKLATPPKTKPRRRPKLKSKRSNLRRRKRNVPKRKMRKSEMSKDFTYEDL